MMKDRKNVMNRLFRMIILAVTTIVMFNMITFNNAEAGKKISFRSTNMKFYEGANYNFKIKNCKWFTSNRKVVSVNKNGKIKALKCGKAKITAKLKGTKSKAVCKITVGKYANSLKLKSAENVILKIGQTSIVKAYVLPSKVLYSGFKYKVSDASVASVSDKGVITPLKTGIAYVTVTSKAVTSQKKTLKKKVTVVVLSTADSNKDNPSNNSTNTDNNTVSGLIDQAQTHTTIIAIGGQTMKPVVTVTPGPIKSESPIPTLIPTSTTTATPTATPTNAPMSVQEYIKSLTPSSDYPLAASFAAVDTNGDCVTYYLLNKTYTGNIKIDIDGYSYLGCGNVTDFLTKLQLDYMSRYTNSANTLALYRMKKSEAWTAEFLNTGVKYYFSGSPSDTVFGSPFGLLIAKGNTLDKINISSRD